MATISVWSVPPDTLLSIASIHPRGRAVGVFWTLPINTDGARMLFRTTVLIGSKNKCCEKTNAPVGMWRTRIPRLFNILPRQFGISYFILGERKPMRAMMMVPIKVIRSMVFISRPGRLISTKVVVSQMTIIDTAVQGYFIPLEAGRANTPVLNSCVMIIDHFGKKILSSRVSSKLLTGSCDQPLSKARISGYCSA